MLKTDLPYSTIQFLNPQDTLEGQRNFKVSGQCRLCACMKSFLRKKFLKYVVIQMEHCILFNS